MIQPSIERALWLNELIAQLLQVRWREGNVPVCCANGNGADYWGVDIRVVRWDRQGPTRLVFDAMPWPAESDGAAPDALRAR